MRGTDTLSGVLQAVRLTGAVFFRFDMHGSWVAETPNGAACAPFVMPQADHVMEFHILRRGRCWAGPVDAPPILLEAGDIVAFPHGDPHVLSSAPGMRHAPDLALYERAGASPHPVSVTMGEAGAEASGTEIICGFLGCDARPFNPLLAALPPMLHLRGGAGAGAGGTWLGHLIEAAADESLNQRPGGDCVLARLSELMFIELVRRSIEALPTDHAGWLAGLRDPQVGRALGLLHGRAAAPWTLAMLARDVGLSRSVLAERFVRLVGEPPIQYLAKWRMQLATGRLAQSHLTVAQVAAEVGYESEAAFSRAFHRLVGMPPATWRRVRGGRSGRREEESGAMAASEGHC